MELQNRRAFIKKLVSAWLFFKIVPKISSGKKTTEYSFDPGTARDIRRDSSFFFRDAEDRYVLFRGVNWGTRSKLPPYLPNYPLSEKTLSQSHAESSQESAGSIMKKMGFNIVRLCVMWKGFEPQPLSLDDKNYSKLDSKGKEYLEEVYKIVEELNQFGIFVFIDFHQDVAHELYGGDGFPDWAIGVDKDHPQPAPSTPNDPKWGLKYYDFKKLVPQSKLVRNTLKSFWKNSLVNTTYNLNNFPVQDHLLNVIGEVSKFFAGHPAILGYEPFNEPHQVGLGKENFESVLLSEFYSKAVSKVRSSDKNAFLFLEPRMDWTTSRYDAPEPTHLLKMVRSFVNEKKADKEVKSFLDVSKINDSRLIFSFHFYDQYTIYHRNFPVIKLHDSMKNRKRDWTGLFKTFISNGTSKNLMPFFTEFGGDQRWLKSASDIHNPAYKNELLLAYQDLLFQQIEASMLNATYWDFDPFCPKNKEDTWNHEDFSIISYEGTPLQEEIIVRPYPMRSSAKPTFLKFDVLTKYFILMMDGIPVDAPTVIFLPDIQYPDKFEIHCTGSASDGLMMDAKEQLLYWSPDKTQNSHMLIICPPAGGKLDPTMLPETTQTLLPKCKPASFIQKSN